MKRFRIVLGSILCPRCKEKKLPRYLDVVARNDDRIKSAILTTQEDSNPACQWPGQKNLLTPDQAQRVIGAAEAKKSEIPAFSSFAERSQPKET